MARESEVVEKSPAEPELVLSIAQANWWVVAFHTSFSLEAEHEVRPAPVMVEAMLKVVVVAFVDWSVVAKKLVDVAFVVVPVVMSAFVAWSVVAKSDVVVAFVVVAFVAVKFVVDAIGAWSTAAKSAVVVACEVVALRAVKFCSVVEAKEMRPPQNCEAVDEVATMYATVGLVEAASTPEPVE
jgi:hypothetical protein